MADMGADSICIKDMAGLLYAGGGFCSSSRRSRKRSACPGASCTATIRAGLASMTYLAGLMAGADVVDCAISPFAMGTSQPATESIVAALRGGALDTGIKLESLIPIADYYKGLAQKYKDLIMGVKGVNVNILLYQIPGGMYSNLQSQLKEAGCLDKFYTGLGGSPSCAQRDGLSASRYTDQPDSRNSGYDEHNSGGSAGQMIPKEVRQYFLGYYGKTPAPVDPEIQKIVLGDEKPITCRPGEKIAPELEDAKKEIGTWATQPEDVLSYIMFPQVAKDFLVNKYVRENKVDVGLETQESPEAYAI
jgi:oxaloacetate decarboxylase alpha subunit